MNVQLVLHSRSADAACVHCSPCVRVKSDGGGSMGAKIYRGVGAHPDGPAA